MKQQGGDRVFLILALGLIGLGLWLHLRPRPAGPAAPGTAAATAPASAAPQPENGPAAGPGWEFCALDPGADAPATLAAENEKLRVGWTACGGALLTLELKEYRQHAEAPELLRLVEPWRQGLRSLVLEDPQGRFDLGGARYRGLLAEQGGVAFTAEFAAPVAPAATAAPAATPAPGGQPAAGAPAPLPVLRVRRGYAWGGPYEIVLTVAFENLGAAPLETAYRLTGTAGICRQQEAAGPVYFWVGDGKPGQVRASYFTASKYQAPGQVLSPEVAAPLWAGLSSEYFVSVLRPLDRVPPGGGLPAREGLVSGVQFRGLGAPAAQAGKFDPVRDSGQAVLLGRAFRLEAGESLTDRYLLIAAPKRPAFFAERYPGLGLERVISYGWPESVSRFFVGVLRFLGGLCGGYGWALVVLAVAVRLILWPLNRSQMRSMEAQQRLRPRLVELQRRHANNKRKLSEEQWKLFREEGINPLGGCLPLLLQMPILIGLFNALRNAIELRQAGFLLIADLSLPDRLLALGDWQINVLPLVMTVAWFFQSRMQPKPPALDEKSRQQQKIMQYMPVFIGFLMYRMASGLILYWTVGTLWDLVFQPAMRRWRAAASRQ